MCGSLGLSRLSWLNVLRTATSFGLFQAAMPFLGWLAGSTIIDRISAFDHWLAFGLLAIVGGRMIWESFRPKNEPDKATDITRGLPLLTLSFATSIDALAVGLSFAFIEVTFADILSSITVIGIVAFALTATGFMAGNRIGRVFGERAKLVGGLALLGIGIRVLVTHLVA